MELIDRTGVLQRLDQLARVEIELGCGNAKKNPNAIGIDMLDFDCVDIQGDVFAALRRFPDASVDVIESFHFFEHVSDLTVLIDEITRVLKPGGKLHVVVPHFSNPYFYSDPTHKNFFGLYTFCYYATNSIFSRNVPLYGRIPQLDLNDVQLTFKSTRPFYIRHALKKIIERMVNLNTYTKEFYEENLCNIMPCYELDYRIRKK